MNGPVIASGILGTEKTIVYGFVEKLGKKAGVQINVTN